MTNIQKKVASAIAVGALFLNTTLPVFAETTTLQVTGNGAESDNNINLSQTSTTAVVQTNVAEINNDVYAKADTGDNDANYNTGGNTSIDTGDAATGVAISNSANSNVAEVEGCCEQEVDVEISGNGWNSDNNANLAVTQDTEVFQDNVALFDNNVYAKADTGDNDGNYNTGGDTSIETGDADTTVVIDNTANSNWARIGGGEGGASVSLKILGNGAESDNDINLAFARSLTVSQDNVADIENHVDAKADTGDNDASFNTGGNESIDTGDATVGVGIDNMANFNYADLNCGCILDVLAKVAGNGWDSDNDINAALYDAKAAFQTNLYACEGGVEASSYPYGKDGCNDVSAKADTGDNATSFETGEAGDPEVNTGDAVSLVEVDNTANSNILVEDGGLGLPELPEFDFDFDLGFNWLLWWGMLSGNSS